MKVHEIMFYEILISSRVREKFLYDLKKEVVNMNTNKKHSHGISKWDVVILCI